MTPSSLADAERLLTPALDGDAWGDIEARILARTAQLWFGDDCAMVTEIWGDCIHVWLAGGRLKGILTLRPKIEDTARFWGLKRATVNGRLGWDRALKRHGYVRLGDELEKQL